MDDRSYREGHPPYCTCVECLEKNNKKHKNVNQKSIKITIWIFSLLSILALIFLNFI